MTTFGLLPQQQLASLELDDNGAITPPLDEGVTAIPLVKIPAPVITSAQVAEPALVWFTDRVERQWTVRDKTAAEAAKSWPSRAEFWGEFTPAEKFAIVDSTIPEIRLLDKELTMSSSSIVSTNPQIIDGMTALVTVGILTEARKVAIITD